ncbi:hypothetical protein JCM14635_06020 [Megalodesulfovibrio paquesii]
MRHAAQAEVAAIADYWRKTRQDIAQMPVSRRDRTALLHRARQNEREVKQRFYERTSMQRDQFRKEKPFLTWAAFREMAQGQCWKKAQSQAKEQGQGVER